MSTSVLLSSDIFAYDAYLAHHGVKGQKWGVRRYQNEDGTLTTAGLKRQARRFTRELNKNDKALAVSRAHSIRAKQSLSKMDDYVNNLRKAGKKEKAEKVLAKQQKARAKLKDASDMWDEKSTKVTHRQLDISRACAQLKIDIDSHDTMRSTRTRSEKIGNFAINLLAASMGVHRYSSSQIRGTKYKAHYNEQPHEVSNYVSNYLGPAVLKTYKSTSFEDGDGRRRKKIRSSTTQI